MPGKPMGFIDGISAPVKRAIDDVRRRVTLEEAATVETVEHLDQIDTDIVAANAAIAVVADDVAAVTLTAGELADALDAAELDIANKIDIGNAALDVNGGAVTIDGDMITANSVIASDIIATGTITATEIATGAIVTTHVAANAITTGKLATDAIKSLNYDGPDGAEVFADVGSFFDLTNGNIITRGLRVDGATGNMWAKGAITADSLSITAVSGATTVYGTNESNLGGEGFQRTNGTNAWAAVGLTNPTSSAAQATIGVRTNVGPALKSRFIADYTQAMIESTSTAPTNSYVQATNAGAVNVYAAGSNVNIRSAAHTVLVDAGTTRFRSSSGASEYAAVDSAGLYVQAGASSGLILNGKNMLLRSVGNGERVCYDNSTLIDGFTRSAAWVEGNLTVVLSANGSRWLFQGGHAYAPPGGTWTNYSSRTIKEDIKPIPSAEALAHVLAWKPVTFKFIDGDGSTHEGFIAEDVNDVTPNVATITPTTTPALDYARMTVRLTGGMQELAARLEVALDRIAALEAQLAA
jgi:hypothetical protein